MGLVDRWREVAATDWKAVSTPSIAGACLFALYCAWFAHTGEGWVHILDGANLAFHEAGHPIFGLLLGERITVYGGTLGQLVFPAVVAASFWWRRETASFAVALLWLAENFWNIARYMADARAHELPLVGGGEHDWTEILSRWGVLVHDTGVAGFTRIIGWVLMLAVLVWLVRRRIADRQFE